MRFKYDHRSPAPANGERIRTPAGDLIWQAMNSFATRFIPVKQLDMHMLYR